MHALATRLFPICRSITGEGVRETLRIIKEYIPLTIHEVPTGTSAFDWMVPQEWNIRAAYIADRKGDKIVDFRKNNLHVVGYSIPVNKTISRAELEEHLYSLPDQPDAIPYITSYYAPRWGFCMTHREREELSDDTYHVYIDSDLKDGSLTYGEYVIPGKSEKEIFISTYVCHPSLANNELSGPVVATYLAQWIASAPRKYTCRIIFIPETIGSLTYMSKNLEAMKKNVIAGFNLTCVGDDRIYSFLPSRNGGTLADRVARSVLASKKISFDEYSFLDRGSDERQYCAPGVDLPVVSLMRSKYHTKGYPEYHTSLDDLTVITPQGLQGSYELHKACLEKLEGSEYYRVTSLGEPQLGRRGLYPTVSTKKSKELVRDMVNVLAYADGLHDVSELSSRTGISLENIRPIINTLLSHGLVEAI